MSNQNNKRYISKYSNNKEVSEAQYITEIICEQKAKLNNEDLHYRFWTQKKWSSFYRNQIGSAHKLLKKYSSKAIINALMSNEGRKIFSLRAPHLTPIIEIEQEKINHENNSFTKEIDRKTNITFKAPLKNNKHILSKLEEIDNDS
jgi:hypothetical protein